MVSAPPLQRISTEEAVIRYLRNVERAVLGQSLAKTTAENYRRDLAEFISLAGAGTVLDDLTAENLDDIVLAYAAKPDGRFAKADPDKTRGPGAQSRFRQSISRLFSDAVLEGWVEHNPVLRMRVKPKQPTMKNAARKALPESSARALLETPKAVTARSDMRLALRDIFLLSVLMEAGPRVSEICRANQADLAVREDSTVWLHLFGKGGKERWVPLSDRTYGAYKAYLEHERPSPAPRVKIVAGEPVQTTGVEDAEVALLLTWRGRRMTPRDVQLMVQRMSDALPAEVRRRVTPHGLRHTAATLLLSSGAADVNTVKEVLGHESIATTGIYLDGIDYEMSRAIKAHPVTGDQSIQSKDASNDLLALPTV